MTLNPYSCIWGFPRCDKKRIRNSAFCKTHKKQHYAEMGARHAKEKS